MAPGTLRKAIGAVKDQTSISIAKVSGNRAPEIEVLVVKATSHDDDPADEKYIREIIKLTCTSRGYVTACVSAVSRRLSKTRDWIVAIKSLILVHRLLIHGHPSFEDAMLSSTRRGLRVLNMAEFRDEAHSRSWDHASFVRFYAMYLDEKLEVAVSERKLFHDGKRGGFDCWGVSRRSSLSYADLNDDYSFGREQRKEDTITTLIRQMKSEMVLEKLNRLLRLLDRVLACRPTGLAKFSRLVLVSVSAIVQESFCLYVDICEALGVLLDRFNEMAYADCVKGFDMYVSAAKMIDELVDFYGWCKDVAIRRSSEFPAVQRITDQLLGTLKGFLKQMSNGSSKTSTEEKVAIEQQLKSDIMIEIKALLPQEIYSPSPLEPQPQQVTVDLVNLKDDRVSADEHGNKLALALFYGPPTTNTNGALEAFPSNREPQVTSTWQAPVAEGGKADWELVLVETTSNLSKQKPTLGGGMDPLLLHRMYDQGAITQHLNTTQLSGGSASSVALLDSGKSQTSLLAVSAPDGTIQPVGNQDPFVASLAFQPPSYVQIADMERKQQLLFQEQRFRNSMECMAK